MANLFATLNNASQALRAYDRALSVTQNNVQNAQTPGYARQRLNFLALPFEPAGGLLGGVRPGAMETARDRYAESAVQSALSSLGYFTAQANGLSQLDGLLNLQAGNSIPGALGELFQSFSAWSVNPNSTLARQTVLSAAGQLAGAFQQTVAGVERQGLDAQRQAGDIVAKINSLSAEISQYNARIRNTQNPDAGVDANLHQTLDALSELVNFTALYQEDGSVSVLLGGQVALVVGEHSYAISTSVSFPSGNAPSLPDGTPPLRIIGPDGSDITSIAASGSLGGALDVRNRVVPGLLGDGNQPGSLNQLAQSLADRVNALLQSGQTSSGPPPVNGLPLFRYDTAHPTNVARSLAVENLAAQDLAAISPGPPYVSNGIALALAGLQNSQDPADQVNGQSYLDFYASLAAGVGREAQKAGESRADHDLFAAQARLLRQEISGVSLDEEATHLIELQRSYEAAARMVTVVDELTKTVIDMLR